jgi:hypothetical protein
MMRGAAVKIPLLSAALVFQLVTKNIPKKIKAKVKVNIRSVKYFLLAPL